MKSRSIFLYWVTLLSLFISISGFFAQVDFTGRVFQILFLPVTLYLTLTSINHAVNNTSPLDNGQGLKRLLIYYCFIFTTILVVVGFISATSIPQIVSATIFSTMGLYFLLLVWPRNYSFGLFTPQGVTPTPVNMLIPEDTKVDIDRRDFLKLIGTAGIAAFVLSLFSKRGFSFLSSAPVISTATITDPSGNKISPAEKSVTDNYSITEIDDATPTAYFGFINDKGQWYIMKEDATGAFRYSRGETDFDSNWTRRENLTYDYFNNVF